MDSGHHRKVTLDAELLRVLTTSDKVRMDELLSTEDHGTGIGNPPRSNGQVSIINVHGAAPATVAAPPPGASCLLGVASNGNTALHLVASRGHVELARLICARAPSLLTARNNCLDTPLHCAAKAGHREVAACLLPSLRAAGDKGDAALRAKNQMGATALYEAVRHGWGDVVDLFMTEVPGLASVSTDDGISPLYLAVMSLSLEVVEMLLRPMPDGTPSPASFSGPEGRTALHAAVFFSKEKVQAILGWDPEGPALVTRLDSSGRTPLHFAVLQGKLDIVELFLDVASIPDYNGSFPLHIAAETGRKGIIDVLIKRCPDFYEMVDDKGRNFLHRAVEHAQENVVRHICENDMFEMLLNATDHEGNTPLHLAVQYEHQRIVSLLVATLRVDTGVTNKYGLTPGDVAQIAFAPDPYYHLQNPRSIIFHCLLWSKASYTFDGRLHRMDHRPDGEGRSASEGEASQANLTSAGMIASGVIATMAFAGALTVPGGFVADDHTRAGTAVFARRFAFRAFVVTDSMAFLCSALATSFLTYGGIKQMPNSHRQNYILSASWLMFFAAKFMIVAFAFGIHLVLGEVNRGLIVFVYAVSVPSVLFCFPGIWLQFCMGLGKAIWRRAGWRGFVSNNGPLYPAIASTFSAVLLSATLVVAIALSIDLPNY